MKAFALLSTGMIVLGLTTAFAGSAPRGGLLELHSCEVYAGPCVVSSEATQSARYMFRVWNFTGGSFDGKELAGLTVAVLQLSSDNLAAPGSRPGDAVVYLPSTATPAQRDALVAWLKSAQPEFQPAKIQTRIVPLNLSRTEGGYSFCAGDFVSVETKPLERCDSPACGAGLWYQPRSPTSLFTVALGRSSKIDEPLLKLKWEDHGKRNVFLARFGEPDSAHNLYVTLGEVCGDTKTVF